MAKVSRYENRYGVLVVVGLTEPMLIREIHGRDVPEEHKFDLDTAERIVLITENRLSQVCIESKDSVYLVIHTSPSTGYVARVADLEYRGPSSAAREISRLAPKAVYGGIYG